MSSSSRQRGRSGLARSLFLRLARSYEPTGDGISVETNGSMASLLIACSMGSHILAQARAYRQEPRDASLTPASPSRSLQPTSDKRMSHSVYLIFMIQC